LSDPHDPTPYAPPASMLTEPRIDPAERGASRGRRFADLMIDQIAMAVVSAVSTAIHPDKGMAEILLESIVVPFVYYAVLEATFGWTLGKLVTGTRVVAVDGGRATVMQILGRTLARFIPFEPLSFFGRGAPVGWHDSLSDTRVIQIR
jgi:uncharacterized RDD family membrane protein YckC